MAGTARADPGRDYGDDIGDDRHDAGKAKEGKESGVRRSNAQNLTG